MDNWQDDFVPYDELCEDFERERAQEQYNKLATMKERDTEIRHDVGEQYRSLLHKFYTLASGLGTVMRSRELDKVCDEILALCGEVNLPIPRDIELYKRKGMISEYQQEIWKKKEAQLEKLLKQQKELQQTGVKHDEGKTDWRLLPYDALEEVARVLTLQVVSGRYAARNWELGLQYSRCASAVDRHFNKWWQHGETLDADSGLHALAHAACEILFLLAFELREMKEFDDRPRLPKPEDT